jgi:curved DNA-binding protein CbpA
MTDFFALLDQPRNPWLDPDELKQAFHGKTLRAHPDAQPQSDDEFALLNEAYQVLRDPKRRLQHLLQLEGAPPSGESASVPREVEELFPEVAALTQEADGAAQKATATTNALSLSLARAEIVKTLRALDAMLKKLEALEQNAQQALREMSPRWQTDAKTEVPQLQRVYLEFSYVTRWIAELREKQIRLTNLSE